MKYYLGLDIGGTKCAVSLGRYDDGELTVLDKSQFPTILNAPYAVLEKFLVEIGALLTANSLTINAITSMGVSCGGPLDSATGTVLSPPNLKGWDGIPVTQYFTDKLGVACYLQNDANACAVAEWKFGAGIGERDMVFLTFGTGLGAGLILGGRLYVGHCDMAGEIGHVTLRRNGKNMPVGYGKRGSVESYCSGGGIAQLGAKAIKKSLSRGVTPPLFTAANNDFNNVTAKLIASRAYDGDELCRKIYREVGEYLGETLAIVIDLLNPRLIVLGGVFMRASELIVPSMDKVLRRECLPQSYESCRIKASKLGEKIGDYAALSVAIDAHKGE